jgi:hypothetical protein
MKYLGREVAKVMFAQDSEAEQGARERVGVAGGENWNNKRPSLRSKNPLLNHPPPPDFV